MNKALNQAIYYTDIIHGNIISEYSFSNKKDFIEIIKNLRNDINVRNIFGSSDNIFYQILENVSQSYDQLLLDKLDVLLIVTRKDNVIKLLHTKEIKTVGVIKIDSVLVELNVTDNSFYYFLFGVIGLAAVWKGINEKMISFSAF